jgi:hypothetical protein
MADKTQEELEIEALEAEAAAAELAARESALSDDERRRTDAIDRKRAANEERAANEKKRRANTMALREAAVRKQLGDAAMVKALDLFEYFPLGAKPVPMPACGFCVVRNPDPSAATRTHSAVEAREKSAAEISVELIVSCAEFPTTGEDGATFRAYLEAFPDAAIQIAGEVRALGGAKSRERPRGRG